MMARRLSLSSAGCQALSPALPGSPLRRTRALELGIVGQQTVADRGTVVEALDPLEHKRVEPVFDRLLADIERASDLADRLAVGTSEQCVDSPNESGRVCLLECLSEGLACSTGKVILIMDGISLTE